MKIFDPKLTGSIEFQSPVIGNGITSSLYGTASWATNVVNGGGIIGGEANYITRWVDSTTLTTSSLYENIGENGIAIGTTTFDPINPETLLVSGSGINVISGKVNIDNYTQLNINNTNAGTNASSDLVATNDTGNEGGNYVDLGINGSNFAGLIGGPNDAYLYHTGSEFLIGNQTRGVDANLKFFAGNDGTVFPLIVTGSNAFITGSIFGSSSYSTTSSFTTTASYAITASHSVSSSYSLTSSFSVTASYVTGSIYQQGNLARSASFAITSSNSISSSYAITSSFAITASNSISSSFASTSSFLNALSQSLLITGSLIMTGSIRSSQGFTGSLFGTASYTTGSIYVAGNLATSASFAVTSSYTTGSIYVAGNLVTSASFAVTSSNAISSSFSTTSSYAFSQNKTKVGSVVNTSFAGNPRKATVTFTTAFADTNYAITVTGEDSRAWSVESKLAGSFVINANSNTALAGTTYWMASSYGETV